MKQKELDWRIWSKNDLVEERTYLRAQKKLPEMESAKQLRKIINKVSENDVIMDVGCASGHYLHSIRKINSKCKYIGVDATKKYINSAKKIFSSDQNASFFNEDIYNLNHKADIVFCCNVLLHLPSIKVPLVNLLKATKKKLIIRTLISEKTHLSQYCYSDKFDKNGNPKDFLFQNTYSHKYLSKIINSKKNWKHDYIKDTFDSKLVDKEGKKWSKKQGFATTRVYDNLQIAGDKVFRWAWLVCEKKK